jgi:hypothetical protein
MRHLALAILAVVGCHPRSSLRLEPGTTTLAASEAAPDAGLMAYRPPPPGGAVAATGLGALGAPVAGELVHAVRAQRNAAPPMALTPTDGTELAMRELAADVDLRGPLAHTELHVTFHNAEARVREGRFRIAIPPGAAVSRFAMKVNGAWREARVVSRTRGREVYETYLHRRVDPALLERDADHGFSARVFPIAAGEDKEIIIAYDHAVGRGVPYVLPLRGLPAIPIAITIVRDGESSQRTSHDAPGDLVLTVEARNTAVASETSFVACVDPHAALVPAALDRVLVLVDTSASRAAILARQVDAMRRLLDELPGDAEVAVAVFDQAVDELYRGPARGAHRVADAVVAHGALGASHLAAALDHAARAGMARVVLLGDAVATLGERDPARLAAIVAESAIERIDVIQLGQAIDLAAARAIVGAGRSPGAILDGRDLGRVARQLALAVPDEQPIRVAGATAIWPATTRGIAPGDPVFVHVLHYGAATDPLLVTIGDRFIPLSVQRGDPTRVRRAVASAEVASLEEALAATSDPVAGKELRSEIDRVALGHGLVSSRTSLLVLESDADERLMLGPASDGTAPVTATVAMAPALSDEELAKLAEQESKVEVITVTGSLIGAQSLNSASVSTWDDRDNAPGWDPRDRSPHWGEASRQVPWIDRHHAPYAESEPAPEPQRPAPAPPPLSWKSPNAATAPYTGALRDAMLAIARGEPQAAVAIATRAWLAAPDDVAALLALGEALEACGAGALAARAYGSLIDLFPSRDDLVRAAGERLDRIGGPARELAVDAYRRALAERPDRAAGYRRLGYALVQLARWSEAIDVLADALPRITRPSVTQIVREDIGLVAAAAIAADAAHAEAIRARVAALGIALPTQPSVRFVLHWETDANDVDLHVRDRAGDEAYYGHPSLASGGRLLDDITTGFGPEMLSIDDPDAFPYRLSAHYFSRGPEGLGLGAIQVIRHDGRGGLTVEDRPFAVQVDHGMVDLGLVAR